MNDAMKAWADAESQLFGPGADAETTLLGDHTEDVLSTAVLSDDGVYRFSLHRSWGRHTNLVRWIMLNPSTADATKDDPTIRRCMGFARDWGYDGIAVVNLYPFRATLPTELAAAGWDTGGRKGDTVLKDHLRLAGQTYRTPVVAAWGANAQPDRVKWLLAQEYADRLTCLGTNKDGSPKHPLYVKGDTPLIPWPK